MTDQPINFVSPNLELRPRRRAAEWDWASLRARCVREASRVLRSREAAEDAAQEAVLRAWTGRARCQSQANPGPWMAQIARNEALRVLARQRATVPLAGDGDPVGEAASEEEPADDVVRRVHVQALLRRLRPADRELLRLRYSEDLTQTEVAARLGLPEGTAKVRLHRLRTQLRMALEER